MKVSLAALGFAVATLALTGCSGSDAPSDPNAAGAPAPGVTEDEASSTDLAGTYRAATEEDDGWFVTLKVKRSGTKLSIAIDGDEYDLNRTRSGAYVLMSGDLEGECDDPGCSYLTKVSGVVYLKKVGTRKVPYAKVTLRRNYPYPEYDGDLEGEQSETVRWKKGR